MFYDKFAALCREKGVTVTKALIEIGLSRSLGTKWKKTGATPNGKTLEQIAEYFGVPVDYFRDSPWYQQDGASLMNAIRLAQKSITGVDPIDAAIQAARAESQDDDLAEYLEDLRARPETRTLLEASRGMTKEQVEAMAAFARQLRGGND